MKKILLTLSLIICASYTLCSEHKAKEEKHREEKQNKANCATLIQIKTNIQRLRPFITYSIDDLKATRPTERCLHRNGRLVEPRCWYEFLAEPIISPNGASSQDEALTIALECGYVPYNQNKKIKNIVQTQAALLSFPDAPLIINQKCGTYNFKSGMLRYACLPDDTGVTFLVDILDPISSEPKVTTLAVKSSELLLYNSNEALDIRKKIEFEKNTSILNKYMTQYIRIIGKNIGGQDNDTITKTIGEILGQPFIKTTQLNTKEDCNSFKKNLHNTRSIEWTNQINLLKVGQPVVYMSVFDSACYYAVIIEETDTTITIAYKPETEYTFKKIEKTLEVFGIFS